MCKKEFQFETLLNIYNIQYKYFMKKTFCLVANCMHKKKYTFFLIFMVAMLLRIVVLLCTLNASSHAISKLNYKKFFQRFLPASLFFYNILANADF